MIHRLAMGWVVGLCLLAASCASNESRVFGPVGPASSAADNLTGRGYLKVYTATEDHHDGDMYYFPHTRYTIYAEDGTTVVETVANAISVHDEDPSLVQLPAGKYVIVGKARGYGEVRIAAIIRPGQLTRVELEDNWRQREISDGRAADLVRLPNGQIVGWRAGTAASQR